MRPDLRGRLVRNAAAVTGQHRRPESRRIRIAGVGGLRAAEELLDGGGAVGGRVGDGLLRIVRWQSPDAGPGERQEQDRGLVEVEVRIVAARASGPAMRAWPRPA